MALDATPYHAIPSTWLTYDTNEGDVTGHTRTGPSPLLGGANYESVLVYLNDGLVAGFPTGVPDPVEWLTGSPVLTVNDQIVAGMSPAMRGNLAAWSFMTNLVKISGTATSSYSFDLQFAKYSDGGHTWGAKTYTIKLGSYLSGSLKTFRPVALHLIEYTPEQAKVRLIDSITSGSNQLEVAVTITLRRGAFHAEITFDTTLAANHHVEDAGSGGYDPVSTDGAAAALTSADADGSRLVIGWAQTIDATSDDATGTYLSDIAATSSNWFLGCEWGAGSAVTPNTAGDIVNQFFAYMSSVVSLSP